MMGTSRATHIGEVGIAARNPSDPKWLNESFAPLFQQPEHNFDSNQLNLDQIIIGSNDAQRAKLFKLCEDMLGSKFALKRVDEETDAVLGMST